MLERPAAWWQRHSGTTAVADAQPRPPRNGPQTAGLGGAWEQKPPTIASPAFHLAWLRRAATSSAIRAASSGVRICLIAGMALTIVSNVTGRSFLEKCLTR